jgi:predicted dinucleotide-binding enzyme
MGAALAVALQRAGYRVHFGSSDPDAARRRIRMDASDLTITNWTEAAMHADVVVLAVLWSATGALPGLAPAVRGKVVISCTNPETAGGLRIPAGTSGTRAIAEALPGARVVAAFNHVYAELLDPNVVFDGGRPTVFVSGDDPSAVAVVVLMVTAMGLQAVHSGGLEQSSLVENVAALMVRLVRGGAVRPESIALRLMNRI